MRDLQQSFQQQQPFIIDGVPVTSRCAQRKRCIFSLECHSQSLTCVVDLLRKGGWLWCHLKSPKRFELQATSELWSQASISCNGRGRVSDRDIDRHCPTGTWRRSRRRWQVWFPFRVQSPPDPTQEHAHHDPNLLKPPSPTKQMIAYASPMKRWQSSCFSSHCRLAFCSKGSVLLFSFSLFLTTSPPSLLPPLLPSPPLPVSLALPISQCSSHMQGRT